MKVLVTFGSKLGGTAGIAQSIGDVFLLRGDTVDVVPANADRDPVEYDLVIIGGALYANRWQKDARKFVKRNAPELRGRLVWMFSSGPLDESADDGGIGPTGQVAKLMELVGARGHVTFGGRLEEDARGFPASAMAKENAGDWRNPSQITAWARSVREDALAALEAA